MAESAVAAGVYFHRLAEASPDCLWLLSPDGRVRVMNSRARALLDAGEAAPGEAFADLWPQENRFSLERAIAGAAAGVTQTFRAFFHGEGGVRAYWETQVSPVRDEAGTVFELLAVSRDVTETVETQAFLQTVIQLLPSPLMVKNVHDRRFVLINRAGEEILNLMPGEGLGRTAEEVLTPEGAERMARVDSQVLERGAVLRVEHRTAAGRDFDFKLLATHDDLGPRHLISVGDDITDRKAAAERLEAALVAAEEANRAKSAFVANMGHELRTPLNGIVAGADMLAGRAAGAEDRALAGMIRASGEALSQLLSNVLEIARADSGRQEMRAEPFALAAALDDIAAPFRLAAQQQGLGFRIEAEAALPASVSGDVAALRQVLTNLLGNALKFTREGEVVLQARRLEGETVRLAVRDTGIGFDPADKERLFDRFQQADASYTRRFDGAGLGLSIARQVAARIGGRLDADGVPGEGAVFWLDLPLPACAPPQTAETTAETPAETAASSPDAGLRVLLADDHPTNRQVVRLMLAEMADITEANDGAEAVEAFGAAHFDLVLMDMQMPVMDGVEAIRRIRDVETAGGRARTPILMLSANALPEHRAASAAAGADGHVGKPITLQTLFSAIAGVLDQDAAEAPVPAYRQE